MFACVYACRLYEHVYVFVYVLSPLFIFYISLLLSYNNHLYVCLIIMLIYLPIYIILHVYIYVLLYVLSSIFVSMNFSNQIVPIYVLLENNVDLFYKKHAFKSS